MSIKSTVDDLRKYRGLVLVIFAFCMVATLSFLATRSMHESSAASLSDFKPGNIISDAVMSNYNSMTKDEIQAFLTKKNPCNNKNAARYEELKKQYPNLDWHFENGHFVCLSEEKFGDGTVIGEGQTAAEIIYQAAQDYRINPQVLIVLLEKEQSLITDTYPNSKQYRSATGYGCPDTAACDTKYYGFKNQVRHAAALFRDVLDNGYSAYPEQKKGIYIGYNPSSACGRSEVYIENRATAALYRYTPYQPNASALAAGYGTGDSCSAYGNRNFYLYFTDWFGSTQAAVTGTPIVIPDGEYVLASGVSDTKALGIANGSTDGTNVQLAEYNLNDKNQKWSFKYDQTTGYYNITHVATGKRLDLNKAAANNGQNIQLWTTGPACSQQWKLYEQNDQLIIESACMTGMVLDAQSGVNQAGTNVQLWLSTGSNQQKWVLKTGRTVADGVYNLQSRLNQNQSIEIYTKYTYDGANIELWQYHGGVHQKWYVAYDSKSDFYTIYNPATGKALDVKDANAKNGANIALWSRNSSCAQKWKIVPQSNNAYALVSACSLNYSISIANNSAVNGANIQLWANVGNAANRWIFTPVTPVVADGQYSILMKSAPYKAIDVYGGYTANSTNVQLFDYHGRASQVWQITYNPTTDDYTLVNPASGRALDLYGSYTANNTNIQIWDRNNNCNQRWRIISNGDDSYQFISTCDTSKALDCYGGYTKNETNIQLWVKNGGDPQKWQLRKAQ